MWEIGLVLSWAAFVLGALLPIGINLFRRKDQKKVSTFHVWFAGMFLAAFFLLMPVHIATTEAGWLRPVFLSLFNAIQIFALGMEYAIVSDSLPFCPQYLNAIFQAWTTFVFFLAPIFTFGFVLSLFKNLFASIKFTFGYYKDAYVFSELNEKTLALAEDLREKDKKAMLVFTDVFEENEEASYEFSKRAKEIHAICFKKDILAVNFKRHSDNRNLYLFAAGIDETENLNQALKLIERYKDRKNTRLFVFSIGVESELLLTAIDKRELKVRRVNEVQSLINRVLYERGEILFDTAIEAQDGIKDINAVVIGMGHHGTEMVKALSWFCQMDGYRIEINAFDKDALACDRFCALSPELMAPAYNGAIIEGEAQYKITIHPNMDVETSSFAAKIMELKNATYVFVSLGDDQRNIETAVRLRMLFERVGAHPIIQAIVYSSEQKYAMEGLCNYRGQKYNIEFIGDMESSYTADVILDSELEDAALNRHLKWGKEEDFWGYEYNYRSSIASAIHHRARIKCGIEAANKSADALSEAERHAVEVLEHRRWNAYMRAEGYVFSGSKDKSSRNDLAKMHHDLVDYAALSEEDKRKDSRVGNAQISDRS